MAAAEQLILEGSDYRCTGGDGGPSAGAIAELVQQVVAASRKGMHSAPLPSHGIRWLPSEGPLTVCIMELEPDLRRMMWIAADSPAKRGRAARYQPRQLATPYIVLKVPFMNDRIIGRVELFYRNQPLTSLDDEVLWPNLLNVSPHSYHCRAWLCTQFLSAELAGAHGLTRGLDALMHHTFGLGGWNWSSDLSEGKSAFTLCRELKVDPRVTDVDAWERASLADRKFVLSVDWPRVDGGLTVRELIEDEFRLARVARNLGQTSELVSLLCAARAEKSE